MACVPRLVWRFVQVFLVVFLSASVFYTTNLLVISPLWTFIGRRDYVSSISFTPGASSPSKFSRRIPLELLENSQIGAYQSPPVTKPKYQPLDGITRSAAFNFYSSDFVLHHGLGHRQPIQVNEKTMLSKVFSSSMHPSNIIPYFYRAQQVLDPEEVTVTTLITSNRFEVFKRLVEKYQGPISVTVHIKDIPEHVETILRYLHEMYTSTPLMTAFVDVHLVVDNFDRQFNTWRNIARMFARTQFVMMLDIDFYPCTDFRTLLKGGTGGLNETVLGLVRNGMAALVLPAFEYRDFEAGRKYLDFPSNKKALVSLVKNKKINMFHASWGPGHNSSDYPRFYAAEPGDIYKMTQYQSAYEPYVIFNRDGPPWCDERFVGYGGNKAACLFEMYLAGISYYVVSDHFIIHQNHLYEETARRNERKYNRKVYAEFREETCVKYLKHYQDLKKLNSEEAINALTECKKVKSISRTKKYFREKSEGL